MTPAGFLHGAALKMQFAPESRWEDCAVLLRGEPPEAALRRLSGFCVENAGVELFYETCGECGGFSAFIGFRCSFTEKRAFVEAAARGFAAGRFARAEDFTAAAEKEFRSPLFAGRPDFMELGLVNMWKSFGALSFAPAPENPCDTFLSAVSASPRWRGALPAPPAVELAFSSPLPHWLGVYVSRPSCGGYALDMERAEAFLKMLRPAGL